MKTLLTLDYELFFGARTGTPQTSMIGATDRLLSVLDEFQAKAVFFVDASYLLRLREYAHLFPDLKKDHRELVRHIRMLEAQGHQIQLHIHPHWADSYFNGRNWQLNTQRYRLADWRQEEVLQLVSRATDELNRHLLNRVFVFRAGGWCIQPFGRVRQALLENGVHVDSTVFRGGRCHSSSHCFDFSEAPQLTSWQFDEDPCKRSAKGVFTEVPISSVRVSPAFFWRLALNKLFGSKRLHRSFGDGAPMKNSRADILRMLTQNSFSVVSVDGYKSALLQEAYQIAAREGRGYFVAMGHPKSLSEFSLNNLRSWLTQIYAVGGSLSLYESPRAGSESQLNKEALQGVV